MRNFLLLILAFGAGLRLSATPQEPDILIYKGQEYALNTNPLEMYFAQHPDARPRQKTRIMVDRSSLWRGYKASFEIRDNQLFVKDIRLLVYGGDKNNDTTHWRAVLHEVFPAMKDVKADWMTGFLIVPLGEIQQYVHLSYASVYSNYILFEVDKGNIVTEQSITAEQYEIFLDRQFDAYKKTEGYRLRYEGLTKDGWSDADAVDYLREFVEYYLSVRW